jgi:nicotinate dehydrogenase subunit B
VLLQWTREEEFRLSPQRPALDATLEAGLDAGGTIVGWRHRASTNPHTYGGGEDDAALIAMTAGRNAVPPYRLSCAEVLLKVQPGAVRTGALRSLAASQHVFAIESFMDELAAAAHEDPVTFRQRHSDDGRLQRVLDRVRDRSGWSARDRQRERGLGIACAVYNGTYIAQIAQVSLSGAALRLERVWCAVDAGRLIWPQGGRNQIEGAIQQGASWALLERLAHDEHQVISCTWRDYPIATCLDAPDDIDVDFILNPAAAPTGLGEPGVVPIAAAIANAVVDAGGPRVRELPLAAAVLGARYAARPAQPRA